MVVWLTVLVAPQTLHAALVDMNDAQKRLFDQCDALLAEGEYAQAMGLIDLLKKGREENLFPIDKYHYIPISRALDQLILRHGPKAMAAYQNHVDPYVEGMLKRTAVSDQEALFQHIAEEYFLSSFGDQAAYNAACYWLDRGQPVRAAIYFQKVHESYPSPDVPGDELQLKWAFAEASAGHVDKARQLRQGVDAEKIESKALVAYVDRQLKEAAKPSERREQKDSAVAKLIALDLWEAEPIGEPRLQYSPRFIVKQGDLVKTYEQLAQAWLKTEWLPNYLAVMDEGRVYYRSHESTLALQEEDGRKIWQTEAKIEPNGSLAAARSVKLYRRPGEPSEFEERFIFGDPLKHQLAIIDDWVVYIEGQSGLALRENVNGFRFNRAGRIYATALAFLDKKTGKLVTRIGSCGLPIADPSTQNRPYDQAKFLTVPIHDDDRLYLAVLKSYTIQVSAIAKSKIREGKDQPEAIWSTAIAPESYRSRGTGMPVKMLLRDDILYVSTAHGVVAALNAKSGKALWATRYEPTKKTVPDSFTGPEAEHVRPVGWRGNSLSVTDQYVIVAPLDTRALVVMDRWTGQRVSQKFPVGDGNYVARLQLLLTVENNLAWIMTNHQVIAYDYVNQKAVWKTKIQGKPGNPIVANQHLLIPVNTGKEAHLLAINMRVAQEEITTRKIEVNGMEQIFSVHVDSDSIYLWDFKQLYRVKASAESITP